MPQEVFIYNSSIRYPHRYYMNLKVLKGFLFLITTKIFYHIRKEMTNAISLFYDFLFLTATSNTIPDITSKATPAIVNGEIFNPVLSTSTSVLYRIIVLSYIEILSELSLNSLTVFSSVISILYSNFNSSYPSGATVSFI